MPYLIIIAVVAAVGVVRLYLQHRREKVRVQEVDGFLDSLEAIAAPVSAPARPVPSRGRQPNPRHPGPGAGQRSSSTALDPERRAAARRRIEARRASRSRLAG